MKRLFLIIYSILLHLSVTQPSIQSVEIHRYIWANYYQFAHKPLQAQPLFQKIIGNNASPYAYKGYIQFLTKTNNIAMIMPLIAQLDTVFQDDPDVQLSFALALKYSNNTSAYHHKLLSLAKKFTTHMEIVYHATQAYIERKEPENAIALIDHLLNNTAPKPNFFIFYYIKGQLYVQLKQYTAALSSIQACINCHSTFDQAWYLYGLLQEKTGKPDAAIQAYVTYLSIHPQEQKQLEQHVWQLMQKQPHTRQHKHQMLQLCKKRHYKELLQLLQEKNTTPYAYVAI